MTSPLAVGGNRARWEDLPESVRAVIERAVDAPVTGAASQPGGFSPALASVLTLADGRRVFAKAVTEERSEYAAGAIRREADILAGLPAQVPAPALIWAGDHIDEAGDWAIMVTEAIDGRMPAQPWRPDELRRFLHAASVLADSLTPAPFAAPALAEDAALTGNWAALDHPRSAELIELEFGWAAATEGDALLHGDLRADNFLLTETGFVVVDWPAACTGARWLDLMISLPSVAMHGGGDPEALWSAHPFSREADPDAVDSVLAGLAGYFLANAALPPVPLLPTLRDFQRAQGDVALRWLGFRRGWS
ncbi:MAG: phosphotransferase [Hamadaea sp.]|uniref:phosphotransferase n=1 Tax=Hamadaea sp. TaxID=2024425 RepID=UPI00179EE519|nr:phosphotransferase [Hamadaea sp.]NUR70096.1 phosphotransferase [Hamadaea sp.]NUT21452.1 phosphotransferase [Hamadaea sp.]